MIRKQISRYSSKDGYIYIYIYIYRERERERERETDRQTETETERVSDGQIGEQTYSETKDIVRKINRQTVKQKILTDRTDSETKDSDRKQTDSETKDIVRKITDRQ